MRTDLVNPDRVSDTDLSSWYRCRVAISRVDHPADPPPPYAAVAAELRPVAGAAEALTWFTRDAAGEVMAGVTLTRYGRENAHLAEVAVWVHPDARRRGYGRDLFDLAVRNAAGRRTLVAFGPDSDSAMGFAMAMGLDLATRSARRVLRLADADPGYLAGLAAGSGSRSDGFSLVRWAGTCPDDVLDAYAIARTGMSDDPVGDLDLRPTGWTGERVRELEASRAARGQPVYTVAAREDTTGVIAGYTSVTVWPGATRARQDGTAVLPAYRGRGFGLWLKAGMVQWLGAERPEVTEYETWNTTVNQHMIMVNDQLGYRVAEFGCDWQRALDEDGR